MNYSDKLSIQLNIGSKTYPMEIDRKNEKIYRDAANMINNKIRLYINTFPDQDKEDYMAMALIDISVKLASESNVDDKIQEMVASIDKVLKLKQE